MSLQAKAVIDSSTGGIMVPTDRNGALTDAQLDDLLHDWITGLTSLDPTLVRPAWQPDPPPIPDFTVPCWCAFYIMRTENDWDPVVQHWSGPSNDNPQAPDLGDTVFRNQRIELGLTFYGASAGDVALDFRMGCGIKQNEEPIAAAGVRLVSVDQHAVISEVIKGRWQRRVDVGVVLRRAVQFTYQVLDVGGTYGTIYSDAPPIDWKVDENSFPLGGA